MSAFIPPSAFSSVLPAARRSRVAFTLVEMIVVMGIIVVMASLITPAFTSLRGNNDFTSQAGRISGTLEQARAYAMANNTYVYVGMGEYLASESSGTTPRTAYNPGARTNGGQLVVATFASRNGTRGYDVSYPGTTWAANYEDSGKKGTSLLTPIDKITLYDNLHLADFGASPPALGNMARPAVTDTGYRLGNSNCAASTHLSWPLGQTLDGTQCQYNFTKVIQFDPQGVARIIGSGQTSSNVEAIAPWMEIDLQPTHGTILPAAVPADQNVGNQVAVIVDCMTGAVRMYRP